MKTVAIVLSGGVGKRMGVNIPKQYIEVNGKPIIYYTLKAFEASNTDEIIVVVGEGYEEYMKHEIVEKYAFSKVSQVVVGGMERYDSVFCGLLASDGADIVAIHDGARPYVTPEIINGTIEDAKLHKASVAGVMSKDTVKLCDNNGFAAETPDRNKVWIIQTPQTFDFKVVFEAYKARCEAADYTVTDDAMVVERYSSTPVHIYESEYTNTKITTAEDLTLAKMLLKD